MNRCRSGRSSHYPHVKPQQSPTPSPHYHNTSYRFMEKSRPACWAQAELRQHKPQTSVFRFLQGKPLCKLQGVQQGVCGIPQVSQHQCFMTADVRPLSISRVMEGFCFLCLKLEGTSHSSSEDLQQRLSGRMSHHLDKQAAYLPVRRDKTHHAAIREDASFEF